jgi:hypothetical protein
MTPDNVIAFCLGWALGWTAALLFAWIIVHRS